MRKDYNAVNLTSEEKTLLNILKHSGYTQLTRDQCDYSTAETDSCKTLNVRWLKGFEWIDEGSVWSVDLLLNPPHEPKTVWELEIGDEYYYISKYGRVVCANWDFDSFDRAHLSQGNSFLTKEEAEFESKRRKVVAKVRKYARPFKLYWENYACLNHSTGWIDHRITKEMQYATLFFDSEEAIHKAIAEVGEDDFKRYYLGVTNDE